MHGVDFSFSFFSTFIIVSFSFFRLLVCLFFSFLSLVISFFPFGIERLWESHLSYSLLLILNFK